MDADVRRALTAWEGYGRTGQAPMEAFQHGLPRKHTLEGRWTSSSSSAAGAQGQSKRGCGAPVAAAAVAPKGRGAAYSVAGATSSAAQSQGPRHPGELAEALPAFLASKGHAAPCLPSQQHVTCEEPGDGDSAQPAAPPECSPVDLTAPDRDASRGGPAERRAGEALVVDLSSPDRPGAPVGESGRSADHRTASGSGDAHPGPLDAAPGAGTGRRDAFALMMQQARSPPPIVAAPQRSPGVAQSAARLGQRGGAWQDALRQVAMQPEMCAPVLGFCCSPVRQDCHMRGLAIDAALCVRPLILLVTSPLLQSPCGVRMHPPTSWF